MNLRPFQIPVKQRVARAVRYTGLLAVAASAAVFAFDVPAQAESGAIDPALGNPVDGSPVEGTPVDLVAEGLVPAEGDEPWRGTDIPVQPFSTTSTEETATGDWSATDLSNAGSWTQAGSSGGFTYSYEMRTPPAEGPVPAVGLSYSSQAVDGATSSTNNQSGLIGDGWGYHPGFIERSYTACGNEEGGNTPDLTGDWCWDGDSEAITLSLGGVNDILVKDGDTGAWRVAADSGWKVELLGSEATASTATSEYWKITDADGTQYFFAGRADETGSRLTAPVFGNHSGEACYVADDFEDSSCRQAYRWLLDKTVDIHGNVAQYNWTAETGYYGAAAEDDNRQAFHRASYPTSIEYGLRDGETVAATAKVVFDYADRCVDDCHDSSDKPKADNWPDTPWELNCETAPCTDDQRSMAFFTAKRLTAITTYVNSTDGFIKVDSWTLVQEFKDYGDAEDTTMWLASVQHTGHVGGTESTPPVTFEGTAMANRVEHSEGTPAMWRMRLTVITSETGAVTGIWYSPEDCDWDDLPTKQDNDRRCYPTLIDQGDGEAPLEEWFHKYVVTQVAEFDTTAGQVPVRTYYDYATTGGGTDRLWAWDDSEFTDDELRTYNQWRGYAQVTTTSGDAAEDTQLTSRARYYRGMDGQPDTATGTGTRQVSVTDDEGNTVTDHEALAGFVFETTAFNGSAIIESTVDRYWTKQTAERDHDGGTQKAWLTGITRSDTRLLLDPASETWQRTRVETAFDDLGRAVAVSDHGDLADADDQQCTRTEYTDNTAAHLYNLARRIDVVAVDCDQTPSRPDDILSDTRFYYDGHETMSDTPDAGLLTATRVVKDHDGTEAATAQTMTAAYDDLGRLVSATDALGNTTTTAYTPAGPGPLESTATTNPLGHVSTVYSDPAWGTPTKTVDPNGRVTEIAYDPLGRTTAAWGPGWSRTDHPDDPTAAYEYLVSNTEPSAILTYSLTPTGEQRLDGTVLYDSLLREVQAQAPTAAGGRLVTGIEYDTRGLTTWESGPNWIEDTEPGTDLVAVAQGADHARTLYTYDGAGRVVLEEFMSHQEILWNTETVYGGSTAGWRVAVNPPEGATPTAEITNARGELIEKHNYHGDTATGGHDTMVYDYNHRGLLATVTDPAGNEWSYEYDLRGNQISATDPDTGTTTAVWDDAGQLIQTTDARGQVLTTTYDALGRKTDLYSGEADTGERLSAWRYDNVSGGLGLPYLAAAYIGEDAVISQVNAYDAAGRPTRTTEWIPSAGGLDNLAGAYRVSQFYLPDGSISHINLPQVSGLASENILFGYNDLSQVTSVQGSLGPDLVDYVSDATYTAWGELAQRIHGSTAGKKVYQTFTYEDGTRRSAEYRLSRDATGATNVAHLSYQYDQAGNILSIADSVTDSPGAPERQCFVYDYLQRLTEAWAQAGTGECVNEEELDAADLGGPGAYWTSYAYDVTGNRTSVTEHRTTGTSITATYDYTDNEAHLLASTTTGGVANTYAWDDAGNLAERSINGQTETLTWNEQGKLATITGDEGTTTMVYNAENQRIGRIDADGAQNLFVAGHEITVDPQNIVHAVRTYDHNGEMIATRSTDTGLTWIGTTHQGTAAWAISAATMVLTYRRQDPFGNTRGNAVDWTATQKGFHTGTEDPTDLVSMGARLYDPAVGRFISRDPIMAFVDSQQINGYSYAHNNPINSSDPSGLWDCNSQCQQAYERSKANCSCNMPDDIRENGADLPGDAKYGNNNETTQKDLGNGHNLEVGRYGASLNEALLPLVDNYEEFSLAVIEYMETQGYHHAYLETMLAINQLCQTESDYLEDCKSWTQNQSTIEILKVAMCDIEGDCVNINIENEDTGGGGTVNAQDINVTALVTAATAVTSAAISGGTCALPSGVLCAIGVAGGSTILSAPSCDPQNIERWQCGLSFGVNLASGTVSAVIGWKISHRNTPLRPGGLLSNRIGSNASWWG